MLRSILIYLQNQKGKVVLLCLAALSILLFSKIVSKYTGTYNSIIVTTPATQSANTALRTVVESYNRSHSLSKLTMHEVSNLDESLRSQDGAKADFAIIRPGIVIPNGFEVIASLNEEKVVLVSNKDNRLEYLKDIRNVTINMVRTNRYDEEVLRKWLDFFELADQQNKIGIITLDDFLESKVLPNRVVFVFFLNTFSSTSNRIFKTKAQRLYEKCNIIEIDLAELAEHSHIFFPSAIKKGELRMHPLLPSEDIDTVAAFTYLVARTSVSEEVVYRMLTALNSSRKLLFDKVSRDVLLRIEEIGEHKNISFHSGYKKFLNGENEGFFQKYSDMICISGIIISALFSFIYSKNKKKKNKMNVLYDEMCDLLGYLDLYLYENLEGEDKEQILRAKEIIYETIIKTSSKKYVLTNSLLGFMVLINIKNSLRHKSKSA